ncbi:hypothetical protein NBRC10513v2_000265 [Rhodotorula toruloides]|uniref:PPPDE domain-containing protein n=1 Tax=Rhodotorula toruloides TaxID=5286 RepID=A0A0K3C980_RHOTO|nr:hypothetical protein AAT19DRAFT_12435 [Rhodotorula toruloides]
MAARDADEPLQVQIVVYDLLPPSTLGSLLNFIGSGVYHSSVQLRIPLGPTDHSPNPTEYAYGGHDSPNVTGVFGIPAGTAAQRMPGLRYYSTLDAGTAFGEDWEKAFGRRSSGESVKRGRRRRLERTRSGRTRQASEEETIAGPPYGGWQSVDSQSTINLVESAQAPGRIPKMGLKADEDEDEADGSADEDEDEDDGGARDGTQYITKAERRAYRILQEMKADPAWNGTRYRLLEKNCNTFTDELVYRLTGRRAPGWLNRAAWVATSIPCIVPAGWIDEADEAAPSGDGVDLHDPAHMVSGDGELVIKPPRADRMDLGGRES